MTPKEGVDGEQLSGEGIHMSSTALPTTKKVQAGLYEVTTSAGVYTIERIDGDGWFVTYPGRWAADDWYPTLAEAKAAVAA